VIVDAGFGPGYTYFSHRLGHGIGMDMHEWPYFVKNNMYGYELDPHLKANMLLSDEPGIYIKGEFGIRLEDDLLITESGSELLTPQSPSLEDPLAAWHNQAPIEKDQPTYPTAGSPANAIAISSAGNRSSPVSRPCSRCTTACQNARDRKD